MAIIVDKDGNVVTVENEPEEARAMFPNLKDGGGVADVLINGTSIVDENGDAQIPIAQLPASGQNPGNFGLITLKRGRGIRQNADDKSLFIDYAVASEIKAGSDTFMPITPAYQALSVFYGLAKAGGDTTQAVSVNEVGNYTEGAKSKIAQMLSGPVEVSGTTPAITALPGISYKCGEVATLDITLPESGCIDVVFTSGSTPTVLTITPPTGQTVKWSGGFDPSSLNANTTYELNIYNGLGVTGSWT